MAIKLKEHWQFYILSLLCIVFICFKIQYLSLPYYWDEAWVYVPAIKKMAESSISLLPNAIPAFYSRGHPLLFFFTGAIWVKIFGYGFVSMHVFALAISMVLVVALYATLSKLFDSGFALMVSCILLAQPDFYALSAIVLPEMFLTLWAILTVYNFVANKKLLFILTGTLLVLTKESGAVIVISLLIYQFIHFVVDKSSRPPLKVFIKDLLITFIPLAIFLLFLLIQFIQKGYCFFPNHIAMLNFHWKTFQEKLRHCYYNLLIQQGRVYITWTFLLLLLFVNKKIPLIIRTMVVAGLIISIKIFFRNWSFSGWIVIAFMGICISYYYYLMHIKYADKSKQTEKLMAIIFIIAVMVIFFSSINFLISRYIFVLVPLVLIYLCYFIKVWAPSIPALSYCWTIIIIGLLVCNSLSGTKNMGDDSPKYVDAVKLQQIMVSYMEQQKLQNSYICCKQDVLVIALTNKGSGYLTGDSIFSHINRIIEYNTQYVLFTNIDFEPRYNFTATDTLPPFQLMKTFKYGVAEARLFKRNLQ